MDLNGLKTLVHRGEDSQHQFKETIHNPDALAAEMVAFSNGEGGTILIGIADDHSLVGVAREAFGKINQLISNTASQHVRSPIAVMTENVALPEGRIVIVLKIAKGIDKPYFDKNGIIWLKTGSDKRRVNSKEELRRLFQTVDAIYADEVPTRVDVTHIDRLRFRDFIKAYYDLEFPDNTFELEQMLSNMNLAQKGLLNLAGLLLFAEKPQIFKPTFSIKAVCYPGIAISQKDYLDSEDFEGPLPKQFEGAMGFVLRNLHKIQSNQGINTRGTPEIPRKVFEEILVNALIHRDYFINAPIRLFFLRNRIEIISPGHLPNHLTVPQILAGNSNIRNPILASFIAKNLLPYRGLGTGIKRALTGWPDIEFIDDREGVCFKVIIRRHAPQRNVTLSNQVDESIPEYTSSPP